MADVAIVGCGNPTRGDDGVGPHVVRALAGRGLARKGVRLLDAGTDGMAVMYAARGCRRLMVVDAARSGAEPGAVFEVPGAELDERPPHALSVHEFRWDHALYAARRIYGEEFPREVTVFLVEAKSTDFGLELSAPVAAAAAKVAEHIEQLLG